jgi:hypothetical protein
MATSELEVWAAIATTLQNDVALIAFIPDGSGKSRVRDINNIPSGYTFPYVALGETSSITQDTWSNEGQHIVATLHLWSAKKGKYEILQLHNLVHSALHDKNLTLTNYRSSPCLYDSGELVEDDSTGVNLMHYTERYRLDTEEL